MTSLRHLLSEHRTLLVLDAASSRAQTGWLEAGATARWQSSEEDSGRALFKCLSRLRINPLEAGAWVFCEGPGSILGIRTAAMALRTWQVLSGRPVYSYGSLNLVAHAQDRPDLCVIADARREHWHAQILGQPLRRVPTSELSGTMLMPAGFRHWSALPAGVRTAPYDLAELFDRTAEADLFTLVDLPDAFMHEAPQYRTWEPQIHRAP